MNVLIIHQFIDRTRADEMDTLIQVNEIEAHLKKLNHKTACLEIKNLESLENYLLNNKIDIVFNLVESFNKSDRFAYLAPSILESYHFSFTGNSSFAHLMACEKNKLKKYLSAYDINIPGSIAENLHATFIIKSVSEHASFGLDDQSIVVGSIAANKLIEEKVARYGGEWLAETYIDGREFNLSLIEIDNEIVLFPPAEILFLNYDNTMPKILDYNSKWDEKSHAYLNTPRQFCEKTKAFEEIAINTWKALDLKGYARIDLRMDNNNNLYVIDVNPNPCLSSDAGFMAAANKYGISNNKVIEIILRNHSNAK